MNTHPIISDFDAVVYMTEEAFNFLTMLPNDFPGGKSDLFLRRVQVGLDFIRNRPNYHLFKFPPFIQECLTEFNGSAYDWFNRPF